MEAEHALIDPLLESCAAGFASMAQEPDAATRDRLAATTEAARDTLSDHMGHEETEALPLVQKLLPHEGWERVEKAADPQASRTCSSSCPVAGRADPWGSSTPRTARSARFSGWCAPSTRRSYARREAVAFRYA